MQLTISATATKLPVVCSFFLFLAVLPSDTCNTQHYRPDGNCARMEGLFLEVYIQYHHRGLQWFSISHHSWPLHLLVVWAFDEMSCIEYLVRKTQYCLQ